MACRCSHTHWFFDLIFMFWRPPTKSVKIKPLRKLPALRYQKMYKMNYIYFGYILYYTTNLPDKFSSLSKLCLHHMTVTWPVDTPTNYLSNNSLGFCLVFPTSEPSLNEGVTFDCHINEDVLHSTTTINPPVFWRWGKTNTERERERAGESWGRRRGPLTIFATDSFSFLKTWRKH